MGTVKDAIGAMSKVLLLNEKVERAGSALSEISKELREHEGRIIRLETIIEVAKAQQARLQKD